VNTHNIATADAVRNGAADLVEDLREIRFVIKELKILVRDGPGVFDKGELADLVGGNVDLLDQLWRRVERTFTYSVSLTF
jgi:hypothetical protein